MDQNTHWRDSVRNPRVLMLDYRALLPYLYVIFLSKGDWFYYSLVLVTAVTIFFGVIEYFGFTYSVFLRWLRSSFIPGRYKKVRSWWK